MELNMKNEKTMGDTLYPTLPRNNDTTAGLLCADCKYPLHHTFQKTHLNFFTHAIKSRNCNIKRTLIDLTIGDRCTLLQPLMQLAIACHIKYTTTLAALGFAV